MRAAEDSDRKKADMGRIILKEWLKEHGYLENGNERPGSSQKKAAR